MRDRGELPARCVTSVRCADANGKLVARTHPRGVYHKNEPQERRIARTISPQTPRVLPDLCLVLVEQLKCMRRCLLAGHSAPLYMQATVDALLGSTTDMDGRHATTSVSNKGNERVWII